MALLRNDALRKHPAISRIPKTQLEWDRYIFAQEQNPVNADGGGFDKEVTVTPSWSAGFSANPSGSLVYVASTTHVTVWYSDDADLVGTSDSTDFIFVAALPPPANIRRVLCSAMDNGAHCLAQALIAEQSAGVSVVTMYNSTTAGTSVGFSSSGWTNSGNKGFPRGTLFTYAL